MGTCLEFAACYADLQALRGSQPLSKGFVSSEKATARVQELSRPLQFQCGPSFPWDALANVHQWPRFESLLHGVMDNLDSAVS